MRDNSANVVKGRCVNKYNYNVLGHSFERLCYSTNLDFFKGNIIHSIAGCMNIIIPKFKLILYACQFENEKIPSW